MQDHLLSFDDLVAIADDSVTNAGWKGMVVTDVDGSASMVVFGDASMLEEFARRLGLGKEPQTTKKKSEEPKILH